MPRSATKLVDERAEVWIADHQIGPGAGAGATPQQSWRKGACDRAGCAQLPIVRARPRRGAGAIRAIDYLFNNAGIGVGGEIDSYTLDDWNDVFDVNLRGVAHGIHAVYPIMIGSTSATS